MYIIKLSIVVFVFTLLALLTGCQHADQNSQTLAPEISGRTLSGGSFDLAELKGQPVVVNFWFPSCGPCRVELPDLEKAHQKYKDQGVNFVGIQQLGIDTEQDGRNILSELGVTFPNIPDVDATFQINYKILAYPTTVFLDSEHRIKRVWSGQIRESDLEKLIEDL